MKNEKNKKMKKIVVGALLTSTILAGGGITLFGCSNNNKQQDNPPDPVVDVEVYTQEEKAQLTSSVKTFLNVAEQEPEGDNIDIVKYKVRLAIAENAPKVFKNNKITPDQLAVVAQYLQRVKLDTGSFLDALRFDKNENNVYTGTYSIDLVKLGSVLIDYLDYIENLRYTLNHELGEDTVADVLADFVGVALGTINQNGFASAETILDTTDRLDAATQAWREKYTYNDMYDKDYDSFGRGWFFNVGTYYDEETGEDVEYNTLRNDLIKVFNVLAKKYVAPLSIRDNMVYYGYDDGSQTQQGPALDTVYMWSEDHKDEYEYKYVVFVDGGVYRYSDWSSEERDADYVKENGDYRSFNNAYEEDGMTIWQYGSYDGGILRVRFSQDSEDNEYMEIVYDIWYSSYCTYQKQAAPQEAKYGTIYKNYYDGIYTYIIIDKIEDDYRITTLQTDNGDLTIDEVRANENIETSESSLNLDSKLKEYYYNAVFNGVETKFYFENNKIVAKTEDTLATYEMDEEIPQTQVPTFNTYVGDGSHPVLEGGVVFTDNNNYNLVLVYDEETNDFSGFYGLWRGDIIEDASYVIGKGELVSFTDSNDDGGAYTYYFEGGYLVYDAASGDKYITVNFEDKGYLYKLSKGAVVNQVYKYQDENNNYNHLVYENGTIYKLTAEEEQTADYVKENGTAVSVSARFDNSTKEIYYTDLDQVKYIVRDGNIVEQIGDYVYIKPNTEKVYRYENENYESYKYTYVVFEHYEEEDYNMYYYDSNDEYVDYYTVRDNWNSRTLYAQGNKDGILKYTDDDGFTYYIYGDHIVRENEHDEATTFTMLKDREFKLNQIYKYFDGENYRYAVFTNDDGYRMYEYVTTADNITDYDNVIENGTSTYLGDEQKYDEATGEYYFEVVENEDENQKQTKKYVVRDGKVYNMLTTDVYFNEVKVYYYVAFDLAENKAYLYTNVDESEEAKDAAFVKQNGQAFDYNVGTNKWLHTVEFDGNTIVNNNTNELKVAGGEIMPKNMTLTAVTTVAESEKATYFGKSTTGILADTLYCDTMKQNYLVFGYDEEAADFTDIYLIDMISMRGYTQDDMTVELVRNNYTQHYALTPVTGMPGIYVYDRGMISATNININNSTYKPVDANNDVEFDYTYKYGEEGNWHYVVFTQIEDEVYAYRLTSEEELTAEQVKQNAAGVKVEKTTHNDQVVYLTGDGEKFTLTNGNIFYDDGKITAVDYQNAFEHINALLRLTQGSDYTFYGPFRYAFGEESGNKVKEELLANGAQEFWGKEEYKNPLYRLFSDARSSYYNNFNIEYRENNIYANGVPQEFVDDLTQGFTFDGKEYAGLKEIYDARINEFLEDVVNKVKLEAETSRMMTYTILNEAVKAFHDAYMIEGSNIREAVKGTIKGLNTTMKLLSGIDESKADISKTLIKKFTNGDIDRGFTKEDYQTLLQDYVEELEAKMVDGKVVTVEEAMYEVAENTKVVLNEFRAIIKVITRTLDSGGLRDFDTVIDNLFATIEDAPNKLLGPIEEKFNKAYNDYVETLKDLAKSPEAVEAVIKNLSLLAQDVKLACDNYEKGNVNSLADLDYVFKPTIEQEKGGAIYHILKIVEVLPTEKVKEWLDIDYLNEKTKGGFDFGENQDTVREYVDLARHLVDLLKEVAAETDENTELKDIVLMMFNSDTIVEDEKTFLEIIEDKFFDGSDEVEAEGDTYTRPNSIEDEEERAQALEKLAEKIKSSFVEKIVDNYEMVLENIVLSLNYSNSLPMLSYEDNLVWRLIDMQNQESGLSDEEIFYHDIFLHGPKSIIDELQNLIKGDDEGKY